MKVAFLKYGSDLGINRHLLALTEYLKSRGVEVQEFDLSEGDIQQSVNRLLEFSPLFTFDINGSCVVFGERDGQKVPIYDAFGFVHVSFFTDEPLFHFPVLLDTKDSNNLLPIVTDLKYADTFKFLGHDRGTFYITPFIDPNQMPQPEQEKDIQAVFLGPVVNPEIISKQVVNNLKESFIPYFFEVGEYLFRNPEAHILYASEYILSMFNQSFQEEFVAWRAQNTQDYLRLLNDLSFYATARKRWYILNFLEGIDLKIVGVFEGELKEGHEHIQVEKWEDALKIVGRSLITIMCYPHAVPTGVGFVPLEVAYMGTTSFLDYRATLPGFFIPEQEVVTYLPLDRADIEEKVVYYLDNVNEAREIALRAREKVMKNYTPEDRCEFLYNTLEHILSQAQTQKDNNS